MQVTRGRSSTRGLGPVVQDIAGVMVGLVRSGYQGFKLELASGVWSVSLSFACFDALTARLELVVVII